MTQGAPLKLKEANSTKFDPIAVSGFSHLSDTEKNFIFEILSTVRMSFSRARLFVEAAVDLRQWDSKKVHDIWNSLKIKNGIPPNMLLEKFMEYIAKEREGIPSFTERKTTPEKWVHGSFAPLSKDNQVVGDCPVMSKKTVCCNLKTIDAVTNCVMGCNYCAIQTMHSNDNVFVDVNLLEKLRKVELDPTRQYHFGTGQSSDSLVFGNRNGVFDALMEFCRTNPNVFLEFKSKSSNTAWFEKQKDLPANMFFSWSLNPQEFIDAEEAHTASLEKRIQAAERMVKCGFSVAFHFHPIVWFSRWQEAYSAVVKAVISRFNPKDIVYISLGTMTIPRSVRKKIREAGITTQVVRNLTAENPEGKLTYPDTIKHELFAHVYKEFQPWHQSVFFYLCMEEAKFWHPLFGFAYETNEKFELAMLQAIHSKLKI
ncbi:MAG: hypothetical protein LDLANPLL_02742 [Turneriella sp.]|nr:hypothetical protein [Turneriella sp.]